MKKNKLLFTFTILTLSLTLKAQVGVNTKTPTETLDNNGITRLRTLPLNGTTNAIHTTSSGSASSAQDQTFTATRTVVADANGVLGYVSGLPVTPTSGSQSVTYIKKTISPIDANTPVNSVLTLGKLSLRYVGSSPSVSDNIQYKVSEANHITLLFHKAGYGGVFETATRAATLGDTWTNIDLINPDFRDTVHALITLHNSKEIYRVTIYISDDIAAEGGVPAADSTITLIIESFQ